MVGDLIQNQIVDRSNLLQMGVGSDSRVILIARRDLSTYTMVPGSGKVSAFTLKANKVARIFEGIRQSAEPKAMWVETDAKQSAYQQSIRVRVFSYDPTTKMNLEEFSNNRWIAIYENTKQDANTFEILGLDSGLIVTALSRAPQENGGAFDITLTNPGKEEEAHLPFTFDAGTGVYQTNRTAIEALCGLPTITTSGLSIVTYAAVTPTAIVITGTNFFAGSVNDGVLKIELINNATGSIIPFTASRTVTNTTITTTTPATGEGSGKSYKVRVTTLVGSYTSDQNIITT